MNSLYLVAHGDITAEASQEATLVPFARHGGVPFAVAGAEVPGEDVDLSLPEMTGESETGVKMHVRGWSVAHGTAIPFSMASRMWSSASMMCLSGR